MDTFSHLSVLFSVILGLAITEILQGFRRLIVTRHKVTVYPPLLIWMGVVLLIVVQDWWAMFRLSHIRDWSFIEYSAVLILVTLLYLVAGLSVPRAEADGSINMRRTYFEHSRWFFGLFTAAILASLFKSFVFDPRVVLDGNLAFHAVFLVTSVAACATKSRWYHALAAPTIALIFIVYIAMYFARI